jgi:O-antigen/teichoic acid export membrane protein
MLRLFSLLAPMLYCDSVTDAMTKGLGQQKIAVRYNILTAAMDVVLLYFLLPKMGIIGYFTSFLVTHLINFLLSLRLLLTITGPVLPIKKPLLTLAAMALGLGAALFMPVVFQWGVFLSVFAALLVLFRVVSMEDVRWLKGLTGIKKDRR